MAILIIVPVIIAATYNIPNTFTAGTQASSSQMNANFTSVKDKFDELDATNTDKETRLSGLEVKGQWEKNGSDIYFNGGNVGLGVNNPGQKLSVNGKISSAVLGTYCGATGSPYNGAAVGGDVGAKAKCQTACGNTNAHMCTNHEISVSLQNGIALLGESLWIATFGYAEEAGYNISDCLMWTNSENLWRGHIYAGTASGRPWYSGCDSSYRLACCL